MVSFPHTSAHGSIPHSQLNKRWTALSYHFECFTIGNSIHPHSVERGAAIVSLDGSWSCPGHASGSRINHSLTCPNGRQTTFEEEFSKHHCYLTESGTCMRTFHVAQVCIHRDISRDSDVQPISKNLVMSLPNYDESDVVLFLDKTSQNLRFISWID